MPFDPVTSTVGGCSVLRTMRLSTPLRSGWPAGPHPHVHFHPQLSHTFNGTQARPVPRDRGVRTVPSPSTIRRLIPGLALAASVTVLALVIAEIETLLIGYA